MTERRNMTVQTWVQTLVLAAAIFWHYATMRKDLDLLYWRVTELEKQLVSIQNENKNHPIPIAPRSNP